MKTLIWRSRFERISINIHLHNYHKQSLSCTHEIISKYSENFLRRLEMSSASRVYMRPPSFRADTHIKKEGENIIRGHIDKFCLQVHNFGNNEDKQMILTPNERSFYLAPDDISFFNIITVPFDTEPPPTDDLLYAVSEEVSSLVSAPRKNSILHIFVCLVTVTLEVIRVLEKGRNRSEQDLGYKAGAVMSGGLNDLKPCKFPNLCEGERCRA